MPPITRTGSVIVPAIDRFKVKVDISGGSDACHPWTAGLTRSGYGAFQAASARVDSEVVHAHQWLWEHEHGEIPINPATGRKFPLDHTCHNEAAERGECAGGDTCLHRRCQNLRHLVLTTDRGNLYASPLAPSTINAAKTHCPQGHEYVLENTYVYPSGWRQCRTCKREADRERYAARRAAQFSRRA